MLSVTLFDWLHIDLEEITETQLPAWDWKEARNNQSSKDNNISEGYGKCVHF